MLKDRKSIPKFRELKKSRKANDVAGLNVVPFMEHCRWNGVVEKLHCSQHCTSGYKRWIFVIRVLEHGHLKPEAVSIKIWKREYPCYTIKQNILPTAAQKQNDSKETI